MRINPLIYGLLVIAVFLGTVQGFKAAGIWSVSGKISPDGQAVLPVASDVNSIKGWMTLDQISTAFHVPTEEILEEFGLPVDTAPSTAIKDLETDTFTVTSLREWLQTRDAIGTVSESPTPTEKPLPTQTVSPDVTTIAPAVTAAPTEHLAAEKTVSGKTTFQDLLDWGVSDQDIMQIIGGELPPLTTVIKDYVAGQGLEFSSVKALLQAEVDKTK